MKINRKNAGGQPANDIVRLPPGRVMQQLPGTIAYDDQGRRIGIVGQDVPPRLVVELINGTVRPLTDAETRAFRAWERRQR